MTCETCNGFRFVVKRDGTNNGSASRCPACLPSIDERMKAAGVPPRILAEPWNSEVQPWPEGLQRPSEAMPLLTIWGPTGSGKSTLAASLLRQHLEAGGRGRFVHVPSEVERIRNAYGKSEHDLAGELREDLRSFPGLLVLDELFQEEGLARESRGFELPLVQTVVSFREGRCLPTIVTMMLDPALVIAISPMVGSRMLGSKCQELNGADQRVERAIRMASGGAR